MKLVIYADKAGRKHATWLRDQDTDPSIGVPHDPPDLRQIDWNEIERDLHNLLVDRGLFNLQDVQISQNGLTAAILAAVKPKIMMLYKTEVLNNGKS